MRARTCMDPIVPCMQSARPGFKNGGEKGASAQRREALATPAGASKTACAPKCDEYAYTMTVAPKTVKGHTGQPFRCAVSGGKVNQMRIASAKALGLPLSKVTAYTRKCQGPAPMHRNFTLSFRLCACQPDGGMGQLFLGDPLGASAVFGAAAAALPATVVAVRQTQFAAAQPPPPSPPRPPPPPPSPVEPQKSFYSMDVSTTFMLPEGAGRRLSASAINVDAVCSLLLPASNLTAMQGYVAGFAEKYAQGVGLPSSNVKVGRTLCVCRLLLSDRNRLSIGCLAQDNPLDPSGALRPAHTPMPLTGAYMADCEPHCR